MVSSSKGLTSKIKNYHFYIDGEKYLLLGKSNFYTKLSAGLFHHNVTGFGSAGVLRLNYKNRVSYYNFSLLASINSIAEERSFKYLSAFLKMSQRLAELPSIYLWSSYQLKKDSENLTDLSLRFETGIGYVILDEKVSNFDLELNFELGPMYRFTSLENIATDTSIGFALASSHLQLSYKDFILELRFSYSKHMSRSAVDNFYSHLFENLNEFTYLINKNISVYFRVRIRRSFENVENKSQSYYFSGLSYNLK